MRREKENQPPKMYLKEMPRGKNMTNHADGAAPPDLLLERIAGAADGLFIMSETDSPLTPFRWAQFFTDKSASENTAETLKAVQKIPPESTVETVTLEKFFQTQTEPEEGDDEEISEEKRRLAELRDLLAKELQDAAVYRTGEVNVKAYIFGQVPGTTDAAGVSTELVET
jgi:hypothetical protein